MRNLTLNEKISIKGILEWFGISGEEVAKGDMKEFLHYWGMIFCHYRSIKTWYKFPYMRDRRQR